VDFDSLGELRHQSKGIFVLINKRKFDIPAGKFLGRKYVHHLSSSERFASRSN
jgi:hypothetical protein